MVGNAHTPMSAQPVSGRRNLPTKATRIVSGSTIPAKPSARRSPLTNTASRAKLLASSVGRSRTMMRLLRYLWINLRSRWARVRDLRPGDRAYEWLRNWPNYGGW
jgi:hypothetical protein